MRLSIVLVLVLAPFLAHSQNVANDTATTVVTSPHPASTTEPSKPTTKSPPPVTTTTPAQTTSTAAPKTTTEPPKTTTEPPKTTTEPPKTTTEPPKTTTEPPKTTTEPATTTVMPTPGPSTPPIAFEYDLKSADEVNVTCIKVKMAAQIVATYNNTKGKVETAYVNLGNHSVVDTSSSMCNNSANNESLLVININGDNKNTLKFTILADGKSRYVSSVALVYAVDNHFPLHPNSSISATADKLNMFKSDLKRSYLCKSEEQETLNNTNKDYKVVLKLSDVQFDAFRNERGDKFQEAQVCPADDEVSDIVPIAVGIALAALVVIVLIAYFIGRRRSRRLAYQSV